MFAEVWITLYIFMNCGSLIFAADVEYKVLVRTGNNTASDGTSAKVFIVINGSKGKSKRIELKKPSPGSKPFQRGQTDKFSLVISNLGTLQSIRILHDNTGPSSNWFLLDVGIRDTNAKETYTFSCQCWISYEKGFASNWTLDAIKGVFPRPTEAPKVDNIHVEKVSTIPNIGVGDKGVYLQCGLRSKPEEMKQDSRACFHKCLSMGSVCKFVSFYSME